MVLKTAFKLVILAKAINAMRKKSHPILNDLIYETPVDTGEARSGWKYRKTNKGFEIYNDVEHIVALNDGHSQQAPANFVEHTLMQHGKVMPR